MREPLDSGSACLGCHPFGRFDMHGMKRLVSVLDIEADRIHHTESARNDLGD